MVYAVCSLTYAAFRRALGREIAWATPAPDDGPLRLVVRPFGFGAPTPATAARPATSRSATSAPSDQAAGFTLQGGLICTALSHDIVAHETTHALLDGLRSSFMDPTNVDVPAFHEGFSDLVALFLHFTYADVVERAIRESRRQITRGSLLTDIAREFGYARSQAGRADALRSGVDVGGIAAFDSDSLPAKDAGPRRLRSEARAARARIGAGVGGLRGVHDRRQAQVASASSASPGSIANRSAGGRSTTRWSRRSRRRRATSPASSSTSASARSTTARPPTWSSASTCAR